MNMPKSNFKRVGVLRGFHKHRYALIDIVGRERTIQSYINQLLSLAVSTHNAGVGGSIPLLATRFYKGLQRLL